MTFNLEQARKSGYTDKEISEYLSERHRFDISSAKASGWGDSEIIDYLSSKPVETAIEKPRGQPVPEWGRENPNLYGVFGAGKELYEKIGKPLAQTAGLVGGGVIAAPTGPIGTVGGAGLGYGIAKKFTDIIDRQINKLEGVKRQGIGVKQETLKSLYDVKEGMNAEMLGQGAGKVIPGIINALSAPYAKKMTPELDYIRSVAEEQGIKLSPADITQRKSLGLVESLMEKMPSSSDIIRDFRVNEQLKPMLKKLESLRKSGGDTKALGGKIYKQVDDYLRNEELLRGDELNRARTVILGKLGSKESLESIGLEAKDLIKAKTIAYNQRAQELYNEVGDALSKDAKFTTPNLNRVANELLGERSKLAAQDNSLMAHLKWAAKDKKPIPKEIADQIEGMPENVKSEILKQLSDELGDVGLERKTWRTLQLFRQEMGDLASREDALKMASPGTKFQATSKERIYMKLKSAAEMDMKAIAEQSGGDVWEKYRLANAFYSEKASIYKSAELRKIVKASPEKVIDAAFKPNGVTEVKTLKKALDANEYAKIREGFVNKLLDVGKKDIFDPKSLRNKLNQYGDEMLNEAFDRSTVSALKKIANEGLKLYEQKPGTLVLKSLLKKDPEVIIDSIIGSPETKLGSNTLLNNILTVKKVLRKSEFDALGEKLFDKIISKHQGTGNVKPVSFAKMVDKYDRVLSRMYPKAKVDQLRNLANIGRRLNTAEEIAGNPSGTGQTLIAWGVFRMMFYNPALGTGLLITPRMLAKLYTSDFGIKWLTEGFKVPATSKKGVELATKISNIIGKQGE